MFPSGTLCQSELPWPKKCLLCPILPLEHVSKHGVPSQCVPDRWEFYALNDVHDRGIGNRSQGSYVHTLLPLGYLPSFSLGLLLPRALVFRCENPTASWLGLAPFLLLVTFSPFPNCGTECFQGGSVWFAL